MSQGYHYNGINVFTINKPNMGTTMLSTCANYLTPYTKKPMLFKIPIGLF